MTREDLKKRRNSPATGRSGTSRRGKPSDAYGRFRETGPANRCLPEDSADIAYGDAGVAFTLFSIVEGGEEARRELVFSRYVIPVPRRT